MLSIPPVTSLFPFVLLGNTSVKAYMTTLSEEDQVLCFAATMKRDYNCKQIKMFLKRNGYWKTAASRTASKMHAEAR